MLLDADLKRMLLKSIAFHVALVLIFTVKTAFFPSEIPKYETAIRVDLVGLPEKRNPDEKLEPKLASQDVPKKNEKAAETAAAPVAETKTSAASSEKKSTSKDISKQQTSALSKLKTLNAIEKIKQLNEIEKSASTTSKNIKGNMITPGTNLTGLNKLEFNQYIGSIDAHVKNNWALPEWMLKQNLSAEVMVRFDAQGNLTERKFLKKSGNPDFDERVWTAIEKSSPFPPPPEKFIDLVGIQGITFAFPE